ncbi:structural molecule [Branchiostoma belcheri]|nr:structural molecule [Branchiostoma belcheri]
MAAAPRPNMADRLKQIPRIYHVMKERDGFDIVYKGNVGVCAGAILVLSPDYIVPIMSRGHGNVLSSADILLGNVSGSSWQQVGSTIGGGQISTTFRPGFGGQGPSTALVPIGRPRPQASSSSSISINISSGISGMWTEEKPTMRGLNDRLSAYLARVRALEQANAALQAQINSAAGLGQSDEDAYDWQPDLDAAREALLKANLERARVEIERDSYALEVEQWRGKYRVEHSAATPHDPTGYATRPHRDWLSNQTLLKKSTSCEKFTPSLPAVFRSSNTQRRSNLDNKGDFVLEREMDLRADLEADINALKREMDEANMAKVDLEGQIEGAKSELEFMKQVHEQEVKDLRDRIANSGGGGQEVNMGQTSSQDLLAALQAIREEYEEIARKNKEELEKQFEKESGKIQQEATQQQEATGVTMSEVKEMKSQLQQLMAELEALKAMQRSLEEQIADAERENAFNLEAKVVIYEQLKAEIGRLKGEMSATLKSYNDMMKIKLELEAEISMYNQLLDGAGRWVQQSMPKTTHCKFS